MKCVILYRINGGPVLGFTDYSDDGWAPHEFTNMDEAAAATMADTTFGRLIESGQAIAQIVELDEL